VPCLAWSPRVSDDRIVSSLSQKEIPIASPPERSISSVNPLKPSASS